MKKDWVKPLANELAVGMTMASAPIYKKFGANDGTYIVGPEGMTCTPIGYASSCNCP